MIGNNDALVISMHALQISWVLSVEPLSTSNSKIPNVCQKLNLMPVWGSPLYTGISNANVAIGTHFSVVSNNICGGKTNRPIGPSVVISAFCISSEAPACHSVWLDTGQRRAFNNHRVAPSRSWVKLIYLPAGVPLLQVSEVADGHQRSP